ncbi:hypothetical protein [Mesorhizobium sp. M1273]|uniref:hypothetical protein n=1 Tax=Mesorhizobium sp. M1273 TaxID=2957075 RepID=UPI00333C2B72
MRVTEASFWFVEGHRSPRCQSGGAPINLDLLSPLKLLQQCSKGRRQFLVDFETKPVAEHLTIIF